MSIELTASCLGYLGNQFCEQRSIFLQLEVRQSTRGYHGEPLEFGVLAAEESGFPSLPRRDTVDVTGRRIGLRGVWVADRADELAGRRCDVDLLPDFSDQSLDQGFTRLLVTSREAPKAGISFSMGAASGKKDASLPQEQSIDDIPHDGSMGPWAARPP